MMCARRICGCALRRGNLVRLAAAIFVAVALAGARARGIEDLLDAMVIAALVLAAGMAAVFVIHLRHAKKQAMPPRPVPVAAAPKPAQAILAFAQKAAETPAGGPAATIAGEREASLG